MRKITGFLLFAMIFCCLSLNQAFAVAVPTVQASNISVSQDASDPHSVDISFTTGNGGHRIVVIGTTAYGGTDIPATDIIYTDVNGNLNTAPTMNGNKKVIDRLTGSGMTTVTVTLNNLIANTTYHVKVFEYNTDGVETKYLNSGATNNPRSFTTYKEVDVPVLVGASQISTKKATVTWEDVPQIGATDYYLLYLYTSSCDGDMVSSYPKNVGGDQDATNENIWQMIDLTPNTTYYWAIAPVIDGVEYPKSLCGDFTTNPLVAPQVIDVWAEAAYINKGNGFPITSFWIKVRFNQEMATSVVPTIGFPGFNPTSPSAVLYNQSGGWESTITTNDTYKYIYQVNTAFSLEMYDIDIDVTNAETEDGQTFTGPYNALDVFSIDLIPPTAVFSYQRLTPTPTAPVRWIGENQSVRINATFSEALKLSPMPELNIAPQGATDVNQAMTYVAGSDFMQFFANYNVPTVGGDGLSNGYVIVTIIDGQDRAGNEFLPVNGNNEPPTGSAGNGVTMIVDVDPPNTADIIFPAGGATLEDQIFKFGTNNSAVDKTIKKVNGTAIDQVLTLAPTANNTIPPIYEVQYLLVYDANDNGIPNGSEQYWNGTTWTNGPADPADWYDEIYWNIASGTSDWEFEFPTSAVDGRYLVYTYALDMALNGAGPDLSFVAALDGSLAGAISFYIDNTPPVATITNPIVGYSSGTMPAIEGTIQEDFLYLNDNQPQWAVFYDANENGVWDLSELYYDGSDFTTASPQWHNPTLGPLMGDVPAVQNWDVSGVDLLDLDFAISDLLTTNGTNQGDFVLQIKGTDYVGNSATVERTFRIDTQDPEGTLSYEIQRNGVGPFVLNANPVVKDGDVVKIVADIDETLDGAVDLTLNNSAPAGYLFAGQIMSNISSPATDYNKYHYIYSVPASGGEGYFDITFASGQDPAGNLMIPTPAAGTGQLLLVDNTDPVLNITAPTHMAVYGPSLGLTAVSGTATDNNAVGQVQVAFFRDVNSNGVFDGGDRYWNQASLLSNKWSSATPVWYDAVYSAGNWSIDLGDGVGELDLADLWDTDATFSGRVVISARAFDLAENMVETTLPAGNAAGESRTIIIDKTPPDVTITAPYDAVDGSVVTEAVVGSLQGGTATQRIEGTYEDYEDGEVSTIQIAIFKDNNWDGTFDGASGDRWFNTGNSLFDQNVAGPLWFNVSNTAPALPNQTGTWYHNLTLDNDTYAGKYTVVARAMDDAGNISTTFSYQFEINRTKPEATVVYSIGGTTLIDGVNDMPEVKDADDVKVEYWFDLALKTAPNPEYTRSAPDAVANVDLDLPLGGDGTLWNKEFWTVNAAATSGVVTFTAGTDGESVYGIPVKTAVLNNQVLVDNQDPTGVIDYPIAGTVGEITGTGTNKFRGTAQDVFQNGVRGTIVKVEVSIRQVPGGDFMDSNGDFTSAVTIRHDAVLSGPTSGIWNWELDSDPGDPLVNNFMIDVSGDYRINARIWDLAGNSYTVITDFTVDATPPVVTIDNPTTGSPATFPYLNSATQLTTINGFNGTVVENSASLLTDISLFKTTNTNPADYTFNSGDGDKYANAVMSSITSSSPIWVNITPGGVLPNYTFQTTTNKLQTNKVKDFGEGWYVYTIRAADDYTEVFGYTKFYLDLTNPTISIVSPTANEHVNSTLTDLEITISEDIDYFEYTWNNWTTTHTEDDVAPYTDPFEKLISTLSNHPGQGGPYTLQVRAYDLSHRLSNEASVTFYIDNTNPTNNITAPLAGAFVRDDAVVTFTATDSDNLTADVDLVNEISFDNTNWVSATTNVTTMADMTDFTTLVPEGSTFTLYLRTTDKAGNNVTDSEINITRDNTPPTVTITREAISPDCGDEYNTNANSVQFTLDFSEALTGFDITDITVNATGVTFTPLVGGDLVGPDGNDDYVLTISGVDGDGTLGITVVAGAGFTDLAGNQLAANEVSALFTIDNTAPVVAITDPADGDRVRSDKAISFTATDTHTLVNEVSIDNTNWVAAVSGTTDFDDITGWAGISENAGFTLYFRSTDLACNVSTDDINLIKDNTPPTVAITRTITAPTCGDGYITNQNTVTFTATFSEDVMNFDVADVQLDVTGTASGSLGVTELNPALYTITVSSVAGDGTLGVTILAGPGFTDLASNEMVTDETSNTFLIDNTLPTLTINLNTVTNGDDALKITNDDNVSFELVFDEIVDNLTIADVDVNVTGTVTHDTPILTGPDGLVYTVSFLNVAGDGTLGITVNNADFSDLACNQLVADVVSGVFTIDNTSPEPVISTTSIDPTNDYPIELTIDFGEEVTGFVIGDITVTGTGTLGNFATADGIVYTVEYSPDPQASEQTLSFVVLADVCQDLASNDNLVSNVLVVEYDGRAPVIAITNPTNSDVVNSTLNDLEFTVDETLEDGTVEITWNNGTDWYALAGEFNSVDSPFNILLSTLPNHSEGVKQFMLRGEDLAGNVGTSNMVEFTIDNTLPILTITAPTAGSYNMASATFSYTTDENITGVEISYNGGTDWFSLPNQTAGTYTTTIGALPSVPANAVVDVLVRGYDPAMNLGTSAEVSFTIDNTPPVITYASPASQNEYFNAGNKNLTLNVNEDLQMAQISWSPNVWDDLGPLTAGAGAYDELFENVPGYPGEGEHTIVVRGYDLAGNESGPVVRLINIDNTPPVLEITAPSAGDYVQSSASIHFTTNEFLPISTLYVSWNANDATPDWYPVSGSFTAGTHDFEIHPIAGWTEGMVDVAVKGSDRAGNEGISATVSFTIDNTPPTPVITAVTAVTPTNHYPIEMQVDFGEVVTGFTMSDLTIANGYAGNFVDVDGQVYTFDLYANVEESEVTLTVNIAGGVCADLAGNLNNPALQFSINYDGVRPTANITTTFTDPTNQAPIPVTITFSEPVATLIGAHFTATNAILLNLTEVTPGLVWTAELTPNLGFNDGVITLELEENMVADAAGNLNEPAYFDIYYDVVKPDVTIATALTSPTNNPAIPLTITFTENVTGLAVGDFTVTNGYLTNFAGSDDTYTADLVPNNVNGHNTLTVLLPANSAFDAATNGNNVSNTLSIVYDGIDPVLTITNPADGDHVKSTVSFTFTKSESITNAQIKWNTGSWIAFPAANGAAVSSNAISSLPGYPGEGSFMITVYGEDAAGNSGVASISIVIDNTPPVITITQPVNNGEYQSTDNFNFTIDELLDVAELRWNGTVWVSFPGGVNTLSGSINIGDLPGYPGEGTHNVEFRGYDQAGNWSIATVTNFTVSDQPPVVSITGLIAGNTYNKDANVTFNTDKYHIFEFSFDGTSWEDITGVLAGGSLGYYATKSLGSLVDDLTSWNALPDGSVTLYIQSTDIFNQTTGTSLTIVKDDTAPQWDPVDPIVEIVSFDKADMTAAIDEDGSAHYILTSVPMGSLPTPAYVKANKTGTMVLPQGTPITVNFTGLTELTDYYVYIVAEDEFGNIQAVTTLIEFTTPEQFIPEPHSNLYVAGRTLSTITLKWTKHPDSDVFIVAKQGSLVNFDESLLSGNTFSANNDFGLGHHFGMGNYVVYDGTGNQVVIRSLAANTVYHFSLYAKAEDENGIVQYNILATDVLKISQRTLRKEGIEADGDVASINGDLIVSGLRPNPASTDITFELEVFENTQIQVEVINAAGQVVANLMNNQMYNDGIHSLRFPLDENNISSGAYFLKVTANGNEFVVVPFSVVK